MNCPQCYNADIKVIDSRSQEQTIRRRRECLSCNHRFTTFERIEQRMPVVVKRDNSREGYDRSKIIDGLRLACRKRPVPTLSIESAANSIERTVIQHFSDEVPSSELGVLVLQQLQGLDMIAYLRFASVYLNVETPDDIISLLKPWLTKEAAI